MIRLEKIASLVTPGAKVVDIGTDHAFLPIYLYQNNITHNIIASDISLNVLKYTIKNIEAAGLDGKIKVIKSNGFENIDKDIDEAIIAGMGTNTIIKILAAPSIPNSLIISSHNDLPKLRLFMQKLEYKIVKELIVQDNKRYYDIIKYIKGKEKLTEEEILLGKIDDEEYFKYLKNKFKSLYEKSNNQKYLDYVKIIEKRLDLKK